MGFRSGDWQGHSRTWLFLSHSFVALAICFGSLSCWKTHPPPIFSALTEGRRLSPKISRYMALFILPLIRWSRPVPLAEKHPQSIRFPPPCFTVGMVFLGLYSAFLFLQTRQVELMPNRSILVSSDHITFFQASSWSSRCSLANFRWACTCAFFSRGTLHAQQDFNPSRCVPNCLQVINKLLLCSTGLIPDLSHHWSSSSRLVSRPRSFTRDAFLLTTLFCP